MKKYLILLLCVIFGGTLAATLTRSIVMTLDEEPQAERTDWPAVSLANVETNQNQYAKKITVNGTVVAGGEDGFSAYPGCHVITTDVVEVMQGVDFTLGWLTNSVTNLYGLTYTRATLYMDKNADYDFDDEGECLGTLGNIGSTNAGLNEKTINVSTDGLPLNVETVLRLRFDGAWITYASGTANSNKPEWFTPTASAHDYENPATATYAFLPEAPATRVVYDIHIKMVPRWTDTELNVGGMIFDGQMDRNGVVQLLEYKSRLSDDISLTDTAKVGDAIYKLDDLQPVFDALRTIDSPVTVTVQKGVKDLGEAYAGYVPTRSAGFDPAQVATSTDDGSLSANDKETIYNGKKYQWDLNPVLSGDCWNLKVKVKLGEKQFNQWGICALASGTNATGANYTGGFQFYQNSPKNGTKGLTFLVNNQAAVSLQSGGQNVYLKNCLATFELRYRKPEGAETGTLTVLLYTDTGITVDQFFATNITSISNLCGVFGEDTEILGLTYNFVPKENGIDNTPTTWLNNPNISLRLAADYDGRYSMDLKHALWCSGYHQQLLRVPSFKDLEQYGNRFEVPTSMVSVSPDAFANNTSAKVSVGLQQYLMVNELLDSETNVSLKMSKDSDGEERLMLATEDTFAEILIDRPLVADKWNTIVFPFDLTAEEANFYFHEAYKIRKIVKANNDINMVFDASPLNAGLSAGVPYVVRAKDEAASGMTFNAKTINVLPDNPTFQIKTGNTVNYTVTFVGCYDRTVLQAGSGHYFWNTDSSEGQWTAVTEDTTIEGFRAYAVVTGTPAIEKLTMTRGEKTYTGITVTDHSKTSGLGTISKTGDYTEVTELVEGTEDETRTTLSVRGALVLKGVPAENTDARCLGWWMKYTTYEGNTEYTFEEKITSNPEVVVTPTRNDIEYFTKFASLLTWTVDQNNSIKAHINDDPLPTDYEKVLSGCVTLTGGADVTLTKLDVPTYFEYNNGYYLVTKLDNDFLDGNNTVKTLTLPASINDVGSRLQYPLAKTEDEVKAWSITNQPLKGSDWNVSFRYTDIQLPEEGGCNVLLASGGNPTADSHLFNIYVNATGELHLKSGAHDYPMPDFNLSENRDVQFDLRYNSGRMFLSVLSDNGVTAALDSAGVETVWTNDNYKIEYLCASCKKTTVKNNVEVKVNTLDYLAYNFISIPTGYTYGPTVYTGVGTDKNHEADSKLDEWRAANPGKMWPDWNTQNGWNTMNRSSETYTVGDKERGIEYSLNLIQEDATKPMDDTWDFTISATVNYAGTHYNGYGSCILATGANPRASSYTNGFQLYVTGANHRKGEGHVMVKTSSGDGPVSDEVLKAGDKFEFTIVHQGNANVAATSTTTYTVTQENKVIYQRITTDDLNNIFQFCTNMVEGNSIESFTIRGTRADMTQLVLNGSALDSIDVAAGNPTFESLGGVLYSKGGQLLIRVPRAATGIIMAHDKLVEVSSRAFDNNTGGALVGVTMAQYALIDNLASENTCLRLSQNNKGEQPLMTSKRIANRSFPVLTLDDRFTSYSSKWNTFCLPFEISEELTNELFSEVRYLKTVDGEKSTLVFARHEGGLEAGKPYLVKLYDDVNYKTAMQFHSKVFTPTPCNTTCEDNGWSVTMYANYDWIPEMGASEKANTDNYIINNNQFRRVADGKPVSVRGYRGYMSITKPDEVQSAGVNAFIIGLFENWGTTTGADDITIPLLPVDVYNINGQLVRKGASLPDPLHGLPSGIYIVNGKKVINH